MTRKGIRWRLDISDYNHWMLYFGYAIPGRERLYGLAPSEGTVIDVGANLGETATELARRVGPSGRVVAIEPGHRNVEGMLEHFERNGLKQVEVVRAACGAEVGTARLVEEVERHSGTAHLGGDSDVGESVPLRTLDEIVAERDLSRVALLKIDVEGSELAVLQGAQRLLGRDAPVLFVEVDDRLLRRHGASAQGLIDYVEQLGYRVEDAIKGRPMKEFDLSTDHIDIVGIPRERE